MDTISNATFNEWYQEKQFTENILEGRPYFNGASPPPEPEKHSPSKLLQCHRKVRYYGENAPKEGAQPEGLFWVGSKFEEEIAVPYLLEVVTTESTYIRNSMWIDSELETGDESVRVKGMTDPVVVDRDGDPILVRARPDCDRLAELRERLDSGEIGEMKPFGQAMAKALENARFDPASGEAIWIEEDYCSPPLAMERAEVLDDYFTDITIVDEDIDEEAGWQRINDLLGLWKRVKA